MTNCMTVPSPVGNLLLTSNGSAVTGLWLEGQKYYARTVQEPTLENPDDPALRQAQAHPQPMQGGDEGAGAFGKATQPRQAGVLARRGAAGGVEGSNALCGVPIL